ncbi:hypothetical protein LXL04_002314 [Taraxacum kok-saghyz]
MIKRRSDYRPKGGHLLFRQGSFATDVILRKLTVAASAQRKSVKEAIRIDNLNKVILAQLRLRLSAHFCEVYGSLCVRLRTAHKETGSRREFWIQCGSGSSQEAVKYTSSSVQEDVTYKETTTTVIDVQDNKHIT